ncbi:hypothetical protein D3C72_1803730 [compost metagenome]
MPNQFVRLPRPRRPHGIGASGIGADIGAALFFGHGHAQGNPDLVPVTDVAWVVLGSQYLRQPIFGQFRLQFKRGYGGKGHGQRTAAARFGLAVQIGH